MRLRRSKGHEADGDLWGFTCADVGVHARARRRNQWWQVRVFAKGGCPVADLQFQNIETHAPDPECDTFHSAVAEKSTSFIRSSWSLPTTRAQTPNGHMPTTSQWQDAWVSTFQKLAQPGTRLAILGAIPNWDNNNARCWLPIPATYRRAAPSWQTLSHRTSTPRGPRHPRRAHNTWTPCRGYAPEVRAGYIR